MIMTINKTSSTHNQQRKATNTMAFSVMGKHSHLEPLEAVSEGNNRKKEGEVKIYISLDSLICLAGIIILTLNLLGLSLKGITEERKRRSKKIYIKLDSLICRAGITLNLLKLSLKGIIKERRNKSI